MINDENSIDAVQSPLLLSPLRLEHGSLLSVTKPGKAAGKTLDPTVVGSAP